MANLDQLKERVPDHAKDLRINLGVIASATALTPAQAWTVALACAATTRQRDLVAAVEADAASVLAPAALAAAKSAAAIMGMNNVYYRFVHFMGEPSEYGHMPARLRMQVIGNPGIDKLDFELLSLAVSAVNGCGMCVTAHERKLREGGIGREAIQSAVRIASVMHAVAGVLEYQEAA
jgi:lipoyl-dependent peroxiredoxin subunit D